MTDSASSDPWTYFASHADVAGSQLYKRLALGIIDYENLRALCVGARLGQPWPNMLFAAVHYLLLRGAQHELRKFYPTIEPDTQQAGDPFPAFRDFCLSHKNEIEALVAARVTNTNEVGRSSIINAGMRALASEAGELLQLVEIGASAGLNMFWDKYCVRYRRGAENFSVNDQGALTVDCELRGNNLPPLGPPPHVAKRVGIELNPVDLTKQEDRDWQCALMWPDQPTRLLRMRKAIEMASKAKPDIRAGDAVALLPQILSEMGEGMLCVYHTNVLYQFPQASKEALESLLLAFSHTRPLWRLEFEGVKDDYILTLIGYSKGRMAKRSLAHAHPHGSWLNWG